LISVRSEVQILPGPPRANAHRAFVATAAGATPVAPEAAGAEKNSGVERGIEWWLGV
jgi:hypothetical protein